MSAARARGIRRPWRSTIGRTAWAAARSKGRDLDVDVTSGMESHLSLSASKFLAERTLTPKLQRVPRYGIYDRFKSVTRRSSELPGLNAN